MAHNSLDAGLVRPAPWQWDQDGSIDYAEFSVLMDNLDPDMKGTVLRIGFGEIDTDQDGRISLTEFVAWRTQ